MKSIRAQKKRKKRGEKIKMEDRLRHAGVKGQKHGIRRYQYPDGTYTELGKARRRKGNVGTSFKSAVSSKGRKDRRADRKTTRVRKKNPAKYMGDEELNTNIRRLKREKEYQNLSGADSNKLQKVKRLTDASSTMVNQTKNLVDNPKKSQPKARMQLEGMSDQQLRERINREHLERQYSDLFGQPEQISKGKSVALATLETAGTVLMMGSSALGIALAIKELKK